MPSSEFTEWMAYFSLEEKERQERLKEEEQARKEATKRNLMLQEK